MPKHFVEPLTLSSRGVTLVPLALDHEAGLRSAAADGELWNLRVTAVPAPDEARTFETLDCNVVGWRTDNFNFASQRAIERLGARKDGVIRGHVLRRDGTIRDTVMYSLHRGEWPEVRAHLQYLLSREH